MSASIPSTGNPSSSTTIEVTNDLIVHVFDSIEGYRTAAGQAHNGQFARAFTTLSDGRRQLAEEMQAHVRSLGGTAEDEGSLAGMAHRGFLKLRDAVMGHDDSQVMAEVDRGEDYLKERFAQALERDDIDEPTRLMIAAWHERILDDHRAIQQWRTFVR